MKLASGLNLAEHTHGRHFLHIPGPTNVPDRILRAMSLPTIDHRGPGFRRLGLKVLEGLRAVFRCEGPVIVYPASGTGAWEAALVNTLAPGETVLMAETGHFAGLWAGLAGRIGLAPRVLPGDWRHGADPVAIEAALRDDRAHAIQAVCVVHNETSTGVTTDVPAIRRAIDSAGHPALLMVDTVSGLGSLEYRHDEWGVDVSVAASQKGLMLPPGLGLNALSEKALARSRSARATLPRAFWDWSPIIAANAQGSWPSTPATNLLYGLAEALDMLFEQGLDEVVERHHRHGEATRAAVRAWGLPLNCAGSARASDVVTAVVVPPNDAGDADALRRLALERFDLSLGTGLGRLAGGVFRIGHVGDLNDLSLLGALAGVEMSLDSLGVPHQSGGVQAAMSVLAR